jgi:hypothetical protein
MTTPEAAIAWLNKQLKQKEIALYNATNKPGRSETEIDDILEALDVIEYLTESLEARREGEWFRESLPAPDDAKYTGMEHYRLVCPFCGRRSGKRRERFCAGCGARLK